MPSTVFSRPWLATRRSVVEYAAIALALGMSGCTPEAPSQATSTPPDAQLRERVTVSGISAGGFMAVQAHVALADLIGGVAAIAAGPYHCAEGELRTALSRCMSNEQLDAQPFVAYARDAAAAGLVAPVDRIADSRVWLFHSPLDSVVSRPVADALAAFYRDWLPGSDIEYVTAIESAHGWPTLATGSACTELGGDFINACDYDAAGRLLGHLYGDLEQRDAAPGAIEVLDIGALTVDGDSVAGEAYAFFPDGCRNAADGCRLHIAFHGCRQGREFVEARFAERAGLNEWAAANRIAVIYPQVQKSLRNPQGCWDWWGYSGDDYDLRSGKQVRTVANLIRAWADGGL